MEIYMKKLKITFYLVFIVVITQLQQQITNNYLILEFMGKTLNFIGTTLS